MRGEADRGGGVLRGGAQVTVLTTGAFLVRCHLRPSYSTTWCLALRRDTYRDDGRSCEDCRACEREIAWAAAERTRTTRDIKRGEAA